jgi:site-specific DNA recombinase
VDHFEDLGKSGYDPSIYRGGFEEMMRAAERGEFDVIVVYSLARLTRQGVREALRIHDQLKMWGVSLLSAKEPFLDTSTPIGLVLFTLFAEMARQDSETKGEFVRDAKAEIRAAGGFVGGFAPYGYTTVTEERDGLVIRVLKPQSEEADAIRLMDEKLQHDDEELRLSRTALATYFNREGIQTATDVISANCW